MTTPTMDAETRQIAPVPGIEFTVASRPSARYSNRQTVSNFAGPTSFQPIPLNATGWVRKISVLVTATYTTSASAAVVAGDAPFNLISSIQLKDATGTAITQPITGYNLHLVNKYFSSGTTNTNIPRPYGNPQLGPEFAFSASGTSGVATFRLDIDLEQDYNSAYGCVPNLDSNASLLLEIGVASYTVAFSGGTASAATVSVNVDQHYWAPVGNQLNGVPVDAMPPGAGDYLALRYENPTVSPSTENIVNLTNRGGLIKGIIAVSRAAGVRTAFTAATPVGLVLDNNEIDSGISLEAKQDHIRRAYGYYGADLTTSYAPLTPGVMPGLDRGVMVWPFWAESGGRDSWLATRVGALLQLKVTPGASASQLEIITLIGQVRNSGTFYSA
ncbi:hypothetical protein Aph01nite_76720 [Acrocarpospora phusangensis]|uniref:Uncharacterized protein n=1 Tax=Acrocarpospora phusangensis TaxID=1070424 RepID=A0A919QI39_9ACTN|nr:hypothetical protein [Acrocarpospora phusangensis]GIH29362.1 hypothetical protein Aph01nite_76720 [Acrocarpospora phusangensis]